MIRFEYQYEPHDPKISVEMESDITLPDLLIQFEAFLCFAGYSFDGHLEIVEEDTNVPS